MSDAIISKRILPVAELKEETIQQKLASLKKMPHVSLAISDKGDVVDVELAVQELEHEKGKQLLAQMQKDIERLLDGYVFGTGERKLQEVVGQYLDKQDLTLATMESLTGGLIASALTDVHDSSAHFIGGIVSYSTVLKEKMGVSHAVIERYGVISEETAIQMARAVRKFLDCELGLGITGVAGPDQQENQPVGTVYIAIDGPSGVMSGMGSERCAGPDREANKQAATVSALNLLRRYLVQLDKKD